MERDSRQILTEWLVLAVQGGNEAAFKDLYELWRGDLRRLTIGRVQRPDVADEVLTDVWLAIARGLGRIDDPACFPRWAFRIVERRSADWIRHRGLERRREVEAARAADELAPSGTAIATEPTDDVLRLRAAIARLPADQRELLHLYYDLERSIAEIAEVLAIPPGTVKSRLSSVRDSLKRQLERTLL
jgi:RNA polymerase sigma-70 factor (ECF subfamily)